MTSVDLQMPAEKLMGVRILDAAPGFASGVQTVPEASVLSLGWFGVIADALGGRPVAFSLPERESLSTVSLHLDLVRPPTDADRSVLAGEGRMLELGRSWGLSALTITGAGSRALVVGTVRFLVYPMTGSSGRGQAEETVAPVPAPLVEDGSLLGLLGMTVETAAHGRSRLTFTPAARHSNPFPVVHGGLHTGLVDNAMTAALAGIEGCAGMTLLSLDLTYHRPIPVGEGAVSVTGEVLQHGRRSALVEAAVLAPTGKALTTARGTFGLLGPEEPGDLP
jgi:uncharacterized protein (TIGR00369 family)